MKAFFKYISLSAIIVFALSQTPKAYSQDLQSAYFVDDYPFIYRLNPSYQPKRDFAAALLGNTNLSTHGNVGLSTFLYPHDGTLLTFMHPDVDRNEFLKKLHPINRILLNANYNVASTGYWTKYYGKDVYNTFEINYRNNTSAKLPYNLLSFMKGGDEDNFNYNLSNVYAYTVTYIELASGASVKLDKMQLGVRGKFLIGTHKVRMRVSQMYANLTGDAWKLSSVADITAAGGGIDKKIKTGATKQYDVINFKSFKYNPIGFGGFGAAVDLGLKYYINDYINLSAAINDLGVIMWFNEVQGYNDGFSWMYSKDGVEDLDFGSLGHVVNQVVNNFKSIYEFKPTNENKYSFQSLTYNANFGAEFIMPFYDKLSIGLLASIINSKINRYNELRASVNVAPLSWLSLSVNTAYTTFGWEFGGMVNVSTKRFSIFAGTDSYYYRMTPQFLPINEFNTHVVFGVTYNLIKHPLSRKK